MRLEEPQVKPHDTRSRAVAVFIFSEQYCGASAFLTKRGVRYATARFNGSL